MISGFMANVAVNDGGNGGAIGGASTKFSGAVKLSLGEIAVGTFDATELEQTTDQYEREFPTGLVKVGRCKGEMKYTKANYLRLQALALKGRGYTYVLTTPDDLTTPGTPVTMVVTFTGYIGMVGELVFEKGQPVMIPFEIVVQQKPTGYT